MLAAGADVFLPAACEPTLVVAALEALLRRLRDGRAGANWPDRVKVNQLDLDLAHGAAYLGGRRIDLTPSEFRILRLLAVNASQVVPNDVLAREALGKPGASKESGDALKVHIRHLREKIEPDSGRPIYLLNVRGVGYMLQQQRRGRSRTQEPSHGQDSRFRLNPRARSRDC
jgi:two-component system alkaline phosphatase synthesis response regulator PhoP